ncbi:MAG: 50S ribosomal protein L29 [Bacteroidota bacterium]
MKPHEIRELSDEEIRKRIQELKENLANLKFQAAIGGQVQNPVQVRYIRKDIARMKTILRIRELQAKQPPKSIEESK